MALTIVVERVRGSLLRTYSLSPPVWGAGESGSMKPHLDKI